MVKPFAKRAHRGGPPSPRCCAPVGSAARVHFMRNVLAHAEKSGRRVVLAFIATAFAQDTPEAASAQWRTVADQILPKVPKLAVIMDEAEPDVLTYMTLETINQMSKIHFSACQPWPADHRRPAGKARRPILTATPRNGTRSGPACVLFTYATISGRRLAGCAQAGRWAPCALSCLRAQ